MRTPAIASASIAALALAACGGSSSPPPAPSVAAVSLVAPRADATDLEVATVNGRPVWGSCVAGQITRGAKDRKAALEECIELELLAQAAEKRGLATDRGVQEATRTAMVSELVATELEDRYQKPQDLGAAIDTVLQKNAWRMHRPAMRASTYVRINMPKVAPPEVEQKAHAVVDKIAAELENETGLFPQHVVETAQRIAEADGLKIATQNVRAIDQVARGYERTYVDALFSIPDVGRISKPLRTTFGWDIVLWTDSIPALETTREELAAEMFPDLRRAQFQAWTNKLIKESGASVVIDTEPLARAEATQK
jgi:parvulin-like peptidyl-prolyl isomerase